MICLTEIYLYPVLIILIIVFLTAIKSQIYSTVPGRYRTDNCLPVPSENFVTILPESGSGSALDPDPKHC
jgi:hypothetical protein